jgi:hypothetical protein
MTKMPPFEDVAACLDNPMEPWPGGDEQERLRLALVLAELAEAIEAVAATEKRLRELRGEDE